MDDKTRRILERPFEASLHKQRIGPNRQTLTYVKIEAYIDRLNEAFAGDWSFELTAREQHDDQVIVEGRLTAGGVIKTGLGGAAVTRRRDTGVLVSLADDFKKAEADALKRASRLLGIRASVSESETVEDGLADETAPPREPAVEAPRQVSEIPPRPTSMPASSPPPPRNRLTQRQLAALWAIAKRLGYEQRDFRNFTRENYGAQPEFLSGPQASEIISKMGNSPSANGNGANGSGNGRENGYRNPGEEG